MTKNEIEYKVDEVLNAFLGGNHSKSDEGENDSEWDSLKHMQIIFALEEEFGLMFAESEIPDMKSFEAIVDTILKK